MYFSISLNVPVPLQIYLRFSHSYCAARRFGSIFLTEYVDRNKQRSSPGWGLAAWPPAGPPFVGADGERISRGTCVSWRLLAGLRADELLRANVSDLRRTFNGAGRPGTCSAHPLHLGGDCGQPDAVGRPTQARRRDRNLGTYWRWCRIQNMLKHESCPAKRWQRALTVHDANYVFVRARPGAAAQGRSGSRAWTRDFSSALSLDPLTNRLFVGVSE